MASAGSNIIKILLLLFLILVLFLGGVVWFDYLGIINAKERLSPIMQAVGLSAPEKLEEEGQPLMLEQERLKKQRSSLNILEEELNQREKALVKKKEEVQQKLETLEEREKALEEKEKSFNERVKQYENKRANLRQSAEYFTGMPPEDAVDRLMEMDDQDVIDILRTVERMAQEAGRDSVVSFWLSLMPSERAARLSRKMLKKPEE